MLQLDDELRQHLLERGTYAEHEVILTELLEVHQDAPRYFANRAQRRAPVIMLGQSIGGRILCVPIEPAGRRDVWRPVTAFEANAHDVERYEGGQ